MTDEEILQFYADMMLFYGELPNFEHEPIQFAHKVKLFKYYREQNENRNNQ
jgi:hypothetical protein